MRKSKSKMKKSKFNSINMITILIIFFLFLITILTSYYGKTDVGDYSDVAKFFAGKYQAKIRSSHSYLYGSINSPFILLTNSFLGMKIMSFVWLVLIILSLYYISNKNKKFLLLVITSPIFWYISPWINPIQISSLLFLWAYFFIKKYQIDENHKIKNLFYSGIFLGLAYAFWDTILFIGFFLFICFMYDKKLFHSIYYICFILVGLSPRLILDQILFNFAFFTILKSFFGTLTNTIFGGITSISGHNPISFISILAVLITLPIMFYPLLLKIYKKDKRTTIFLILSLLLILANPQIRYTLLLIPIILLKIKDNLTKKQFIFQIIFSLVISLIFITPYLLYINNSFDNQEKIQQDLDSIANDFPNQKFIVGNKPDDYQYLAHLYWGNKIKEFISIQDYKLWLNNETIIFEKQFHPKTNINNRREIWIKGGLSLSEKNTDNYSDINYAISSETQINLKNFKLIKSYKTLNVFHK